MHDNGSGKRPTYPQSWHAYNDAQVHEKDRVLQLLAALCETIAEPIQECGRKRIPLRDAIFAIVLKVYTTFSGRRAASDMRACGASGHLTKVPHYNSTFRKMNDATATEILVNLIEASAAPLAEFENRAGQFAVDATGFSTVVYQRWFGHPQGEKKTWVKLHVMVGTVTNVVTAARVTPANVADCPMLPELVGRTVKRFGVKQVSADKAYLSRLNLKVIESVNAVPFIPFKRGSPGMNSASRPWQRMYCRFVIETEKFFDNYHRRSNVEATMGAIKRKFGAAVRSRRLIAQTNEVLAKVLLHNLTCLVHAMAKFGIEADFDKLTDASTTI